LWEPVAIVSEQYLYTPFNVIYAAHFTHHRNKQAEVCTMSMLSLWLCLGTLTGTHTHTHNDHILYLICHLLQAVAFNCHRAVRVVHSQFFFSSLRHQNCMQPAGEILSVRSLGSNWTNLHPLVKLKLKPNSANIYLEHKLVKNALISGYQYGPFHGVASWETPVVSIHFFTWTQIV
jgi:hypothetical protein